MKRLALNPSLRIHGEDGAVLEICYSNRGDPYRDGVEFWLGVNIVLNIERPEGFGVF